LMAALQYKDLPWFIVKVRLSLIINSSISNLIESFLI
jgi:hypothetical protein